MRLVGGWLFFRGGHFFFDVQDISKRERSLGGWLVGVGFFPIFFGIGFTLEFCWGRFFTHFDVVSIFFSLGLVETTKKDLMT